MKKYLVTFTSILLSVLIIILSSCSQPVQLGYIDTIMGEKDTSLFGKTIFTKEDITSWLELDEDEIIILKKSYTKEKNESNEILFFGDHIFIYFYSNAEDAHNAYVGTLGLCWEGTEYDLLYRINNIIIKHHFKRSAIYDGEYSSFEDYFEKSAQNIELISRVFDIDINDQNRIKDCNVIKQIKTLDTTKILDYFNNDDNYIIDYIKYGDESAETLSKIETFKDAYVIRNKEDNTYLVLKNYYTQEEYDNGMAETTHPASVMITYIKLTLSTQKAEEDSIQIFHYVLYSPNSNTIIWTNNKEWVNIIKEIS